MELTKNDIGRTFLWLSGAARLATLIDLNPADDDDVKIAPESGGKVWVNPAELFPVRQGSNPTAVAALINIAQDLVDYEKLRAHVREALALLGEPDFAVPKKSLLEAVLQLRKDVAE